MIISLIEAYHYHPSTTFDTLQCVLLYSCTPPPPALAIPLCVTAKYFQVFFCT